MSIFNFRKKKKEKHYFNYEDLKAVDALIWDEKRDEEKLKEAVDLELQLHKIIDLKEGTKEDRDKLMLRLTSEIHQYTHILWCSAADILSFVHASGQMLHESGAFVYAEEKNDGELRKVLEGSVGKNISFNHSNLHSIAKERIFLVRRIHSLMFYLSDLSPYYSMRANTALNHFYYKDCSMKKYTLIVDGPEAGRRKLEIFPSEVYRAENKDNSEETRFTEFQLYAVISSLYEEWRREFLLFGDFKEYMSELDSNPAIFRMKDKKNEDTFCRFLKNEFFINEYYNKVFSLMNKDGFHQMKDEELRKYVLEMKTLYHDICFAWHNNLYTGRFLEEKTEEALPREMWGPQDKSVVNDGITIYDVGYIYYHPKEKTEDTYDITGLREIDIELGKKMYREAQRRVV